MMSRLAALAIVAVLAVGLFPSVGARPVDDLQVLDSIGIGAAVGLVTRVPAESPGGAVYASTALTLDKAQARAAGIYPGYLVDAFLQTSVPGYTNPSEAEAQFPPGAHPTEDRVETGQGGDDAELGSFEARAGDEPSAAADARAARATAPSGVLIVDDGTASSRSMVEPDGTVITEVHATAAGVQIGDAVRIGAARTTVAVHTPPGGEPVIDIERDVTGVFVVGVAARLTDEGLVVAERSIVTPAELAAFDEALSALAEAGIEIGAAPTTSSAATGSGRASTAALLVRVTDQSSGTSEEVLLAQAFATSTAVPALESGDVDAGLGLDIPPPVVPGGSASARGTEPRAGAGSSLPASDAPLSAVSAPTRTTDDEFFGVPRSASARLAASFQGFYGAVVALALLTALVTAVVARRRSF